MSSYGDSTENPVIDPAVITVDVPSSSTEPDDNTVIDLSTAGTSEPIPESYRFHPPKTFSVSRFVVALIAAIALFPFFHKQRRS